MTKEEKERRAEERDRAMQEYFRLQAEQDGCAGPSLLMVVVSILIMSAVMSCRCIPTPPDPPVEKVRIEYRDRKDSILIHDSIYIEKTIKGDTVTVLEYRYRERFRDHHDTLVVRDTVPVYVPREVVKVDHSLTWWQKGLCTLGISSLILFIVCILRRFGF